MVKIPQKNAVREVPECPVYNVNVESLFLTNHRAMVPEYFCHHILSGFFKIWTGLWDIIHHNCKVSVWKLLFFFFNLLQKLESENSGGLSVPASTTELLCINLITPIKIFLIFWCQIFARVVLGSWNTEYIQATAEVHCTFIYIYTRMYKHTYPVKLLVLLSKLAHFKLILINLQFCTVHVHLYTYNAHTSVYTCVDIYMYVSCGFFRINLG